LKAIVTGMIATYPVGGVAWDYGQYALGLERLGWDVYYLEDTGWEAYDPVQCEYGPDYRYGLQFLRQSLAKLSPTLAQRWHVRAMNGQTHGIPSSRLAALVSEADLFLNVSGGTLLRDEYMSCPRKVLIDTDPGWNHFVNFPKWDASPGWQGSLGYRAHDYFFTYAERVGEADCELPDLGIAWQSTRPPVVLNCWRRQPPGSTWTTVMTWDNFRQPIQFNGKVYGTKELEFGRVESLPRHVPSRFEVAVGGAAPPVDQWRALGWTVVDSHSISGTMDQYRSYIQCSRGEFSVAKNVYVATGSGWFSCRSVCYLAAGLPVVVQDTGFSKIIPTGEGLLSFSSLDAASDAVSAVERDYQFHQRRAREIAEAYFDSAVVIGSLLHRIGTRLSDGHS
jgi:hypothetical protein